MRWFQTAHGIVLSAGIFCFLAGVAAVTSGNLIAGYAAVVLLVAGAVASTVGVLLLLRRRGEARPGQDTGSGPPS